MAKAGNIDLAALSAWMDSRGLPAGSITESMELTGGSQNVLTRIEKGGRSYVLRQPPLHPRPESNETMRREMTVLQALADSAVPHPALIAGCADEGEFGAAFYLMEPIDGFNPTSGLPHLHASSSAVRRRMGLAMVEALATLGEVDHVAVGLNGFGRPDSYLERQVGRWAAQLAGYEKFASWSGPAGIGDVASIGEWLEANRPESFVPGIIHGDYHLANVMFRPDSGEVAAIVDWELATIGDPLVDLGWMLATWPEDGEAPIMNISPWDGFPTQAELAAHYRAHSRRRSFDAGWYAVFGCYKLAILLEGTYARACAGKAPVEIGQKLHERAQWLIERGARWIAHGPPMADA